MERTPVELTREAVAELSERTVAQVRRLDCSMYNTCLDVAVSGDWAGFGCSGCKAYEAVVDPEQRMHDILALRAAAEAAENVERIGKAGRRIGVKPGADAKRSVKLKVVRDQDEHGLLAEGTNPGLDISALG